MKKFYIQPGTNVQLLNMTNHLCVGSVHGNTSIQYGGAATPESGIEPG